MTVIDPLFGMEIDPTTAFNSREHAVKTFYFCSQGGIEKFDGDPHRYGHPDEHEHPNAQEHPPS